MESCLAILGRVEDVLFLDVPRTHPRALSPLVAGLARIQSRAGTQWAYADFLRNGGLNPCAFSYCQGRKWDSEEKH